MSVGYVTRGEVSTVSSVGCELPECRLESRLECRPECRLECRLRVRQSVGYKDSAGVSVAFVRLSGWLRSFVTWLKLNILLETVRSQFQGEFAMRLPVLTASWFQDWYFWYSAYLPRRDSSDAWDAERRQESCIFYTGLHLSIVILHLASSHCKIPKAYETF